MVRDIPVPHPSLPLHIALLSTLPLHPAACAQAADLAGADEDQVRMMEERVILVDENDVVLGSASKKECACPLMDTAKCAGRGSQDSTCARAPAPAESGG
jgi:hypothetical protein